MSGAIIDQKKSDAVNNPTNTNNVVEGEYVHNTSTQNPIYSSPQDSSNNDGTLVKVLAIMGAFIFIMFMLCSCCCLVLPLLATL